MLSQSSSFVRLISVRDRNFTISPQISHFDFANLCDRPTVRQESPNFLVGVRSVRNWLSHRHYAQTFSHFFLRICLPFDLFSPFAFSPFVCRKFAFSPLLLQNFGQMDLNLLKAVLVGGQPGGMAG